MTSRGTRPRSLCSAAMQAGGLGGEGGAAVGGPAAERGDDVVVDAAGAGGRVGQVDQGVPGLVERGDGGAGGCCLAGADFAGDHAERPARGRTR